MRALVQRIAQASVEIDGTEAARTGRGLLILLGVAEDDEEADAEYLAPKIANLRILPTRPTASTSPPWTWGPRRWW